MIKRSIFKNFSIYFFLSILSIFLAITSSCSNFMDGAEVLESLEKIVEEVSAPVVTVTVGVDNPEYGTTVPSDPRELKLNKEYEIQFKPTSKFQFISWKVTCSDSSVELDKTVKIEDAKALVTKVTVLQELADGVTLSISPVVVQKLGISNYIPLEDGKENTRDSSIIITFDKPISSNSKLDKIEIVSQGDSIKEHFKTPVINGNILTIAADESNLIDLGSDKTRNVTVKIPEELYYDSDDTIVPLGSAFSWTYKINSSTDVKSEITCSTVPDNGTIIPNELRKYSIGESFSISFTPKDNILFEEWSIKDSNGKDVDTSIISIDDKNSLTPIVTVHSEIKGVSIRPVVYQKLDVSSYTPLADGKENTKDTTISITFDKTISPENDVATIQITSQGESVKEYFGTPIINGNIITIAPLISNLIPFGEEKTKNITVTIPESFFYVVEGKKIQLGKEIKWTYKINSSTDVKSEITCSTTTVQGTVTPNELKKYNLGDSFELVFTPNEYVFFKKWIIKGPIEGEEVPDTVIHIDDINSPSTKVTVLAEMKGVSIIPETIILPVIIDVEPKFSYAGEPWDSDIVIKFNKPMDINSFYLKEENTDPGTSLNSPYLYTYNYSIEDLADGSSYNGGRSGYGPGYYLPVLSDDLKTVTFLSKKMGVASFSEPNTPESYSRDIILKLSKKIKDTDGISISEQYPEGYEYEFRLINEKCKNKLEFSDLQMCYANFVNKDLSNTPDPNNEGSIYTLKEDAEFFKLYKYTSTANDNDKMAEQKQAYDGENPLEHMENNLLLLDNRDYQKSIFLVFNKNYDSRISQNVAVFIRSIKRKDNRSNWLIQENFGYDTADLVGMDYETRIESFPLMNYSGTDKVVLPLDSYFKNLFSDEGIYELIITLEEYSYENYNNFGHSWDNIASNSYICYVGYKKNINEYIPQLEMKYKDGQLSYNKDVHIKYGEYIDINGDTHNCTFKYPFEVTFDSANDLWDDESYVISNKYYKQNISFAFGQTPKIIMQRQIDGNTKTEFIPTYIEHEYISSIESINWYDSSEMKVTSDLSSDEIADTVIIPTSTLSDNQKINIYQVEIITVGDKKTYIYGNPCEYIYKESGNLPIPEIETVGEIATNGVEDCKIDIILKNHSDFSDDVIFYYCTNNTNVPPSNITFEKGSIVFDENDNSMIEIPSDKIGYAFVVATNVKSTSFSDGFAFDTTANNLDKIRPVLDGEIIVSELKRDIFGQYLIPVIDNKGFQENQSFTYTSRDGEFPVSFNSVITRRDDDETKGYLHISRTNAPNEWYETSTSEINFDFYDKNGNFQSGSIKITEDGSGACWYNNNGFYCSYTEDEDYDGWEYAKFEEDGSLDLSKPTYPIYNRNMPELYNTFICVNVTGSRRRYAPVICYTSPTPCSLKHVYCDNNGVTVFINNNSKALVLIYAIPKKSSQIDISSQNADYVLREGILYDSYIIEESQTIDCSNINAGVYYVIKVVFEDNTTQTTGVYEVYN